MTQVLQLRGTESMDALDELSMGGRALSLDWHVNSPRTLVYSANGGYIMGMDIYRPSGRRGSDPRALDAYGEDLRFDWSDTSWRADPDLSAGWLEYVEWSETHEEDGEEDFPDEWIDLEQLAIDGYSPTLAEGVTSAFVFIGRITGREFDHDWMRGVHSCYLIE
ncbi:hypothetical protein C1I98_26150 [Spongiactinospora gelatinilytica]|uniref:Uncharacterized protein n=1 Tax=Spongiactinospora gelatinilytica TaxID=2666298 RepID=A0A2W2G385_9ACTN|nr:hypothetical protein [Spongiactinospora gelatinilytica]PZG36839.1 hypothetical protein C1I98_26150 [Spongiactinospora gelatinilytica]